MMHNSCGKYNFAAVNVSFNQSTYGVDENGGQVQVVLTLSNPSAIYFDIPVTDSEGTKFGRQTRYIVL